ncbi:uncharacterized protein DFL_007774 [Arthrobotrys flagrans]|uniref:ER-bound oxygenase mpaB/mpaB'/Rubber oxygenase catalytic domain-containing protein n=1 Tax=Arthrobotrys flagrans TaxID=97331 RepID=A0A436ZWM8_ARTFL|nr:hypothetical protein DFL_007774 [Arthrobotrys flagrans]
MEALVDVVSSTAKDIPVLKVLCASTIVSYLLIVRHLRHRNLNKFLRTVQNECGIVTKSSDLSICHAEQAVKLMGQWDFPRITRLALQFALFRTYGIPTISSLLWKTRQLAQRSTAHRRYVDTSVLIIELMSSPLGSPRAKIAIERINYLHNRYKGSISNNDLLYTLALFMCQPPLFINKYEWRKMHPVELMGIHRFWSQVGIMMGITGIPDSFEGTYEWANEYERRYMQPAETNRNVAGATVDILVYFVPKFMHSATIPVIHAVCDQRLRASFNWPDPPGWIEPVVNGFFGVRAFCMRNFVLPRFEKHSAIQLDPIDPSVPLLERRYYFNLWETDPWYLKRTWWNSYGPIGWLCMAMGWGIPNEEEFESVKGYRLGDLGPRSTVGKGAGNEGWDHGSLLGGGSIVESSGKCPMFMG